MADFMIPTASDFDIASGSGFCIDPNDSFAREQDSYWFARLCDSVPVAHPAGDDELIKPSSEPVSQKPTDTPTFERVRHATG